MAEIWTRYSQDLNWMLALTVKDGTGGAASGVNFSVTDFQGPCSNPQVFSEKTENFVLLLADAFRAL